MAKTRKAKAPEVPESEPSKAPETKQEKFMRLAPPRVNRALKALDSVAKLAAYKPSEQHARAVVNCLSSKMAELKGRLEGVKGSAGFTLPE